MKNTIRNLLFLSCLLFSISYDSYTIGVDYDRRNEIYSYPGICFSGGSCYGARWEKLGYATFSLGTSFGFAAFVLWLRKKQREDSTLSILRLKERIAKIKLIGK